MTNPSGLDPHRLERITDHLMRNYIEPGKIAGCQIAVRRHGHLAEPRREHADAVTALQAQHDKVS